MNLFSRPVTHIVFFFLVVYGLLYWHTSRQETFYEASAPAYIGRALTEISSWKRRDLESHLSAAAKAAITPQQMQGVLERHEPLGQYYGVDDLKFSRLASVMSLFASTPKISYSGDAEFKNGRAALTITLVPEDGTYKIYNVNLTPRVTAQID